MRVPDGAETYKQVAHDDLHHLGPETGAAAEELLKEPDEEVAEGSADKRSIGGHLWDTRGEVVAMLIAILCEPGCDELLSSGQGAGGEHLCA